MLICWACGFWWRAPQQQWQHFIWLFLSFSAFFLFFCVSELINKCPKCALHMSCWELKFLYLVLGFITLEFWKCWNVEASQLALFFNAVRRRRWQQTTNVYTNVAVWSMAVALSAPVWNCGTMSNVCWKVISMNSTHVGCVFAKKRLSQRKWQAFSWTAIN